jgi:hypothetical protein
MGDHVIGRGFMPGGVFSAEYPPVRVPACDECQRKWNEDEHYLMSIFPLDVDNRHPAARQVASRQVTESLTKFPAVWKRVSRTARKCRVRTSFLAPVQETAVIEPEGRPFHRVLGKITRGLFFAMSGDRLPVDYEVAAFDIDFAEYTRELIRMQSLEHLVHREIGNGVFRYCFVRHKDDPARTWWLMSLYGGHYFKVFTDIPRLPGDILILHQAFRTLNPGEYFLLTRSEDDAVLCATSPDETGALPIRAFMHPSLLINFFIVRRTGMNVEAVA